MSKRPSDLQLLDDAHLKILELESVNRDMKEQYSVLEKSTKKALTQYAVEAFLQEKKIPNKLSTQLVSLCATRFEYDIFSNQLRAFDETGRKMYGPDAVTPYSPEDWLVDTLGDILSAYGQDVAEKKKKEVER